jgi:nucleoid DNA-binding protein
MKKGKNRISKTSHNQVVEIVCNRTGSSKDEVEKYIDCYIDTIMDLMCSGNNVGIRHLGTLKVEEVAEKCAWDFQQKAKVVRPIRVLPKMSFNREFTNQVKNKKK